MSEVWLQENSYANTHAFSYVISIIFLLFAPQKRTRYGYGEKAFPLKLYLVFNF